MCSSLQDGDGESGLVAPGHVAAGVRYTDARDDSWTDRQFRAWLDGGAIELLSRGLYLRRDTSLIDTDLLEIAARAPVVSTLCLRSALARHELIDDIPAEIDVALPRGQRGLTARLVEDDAVIASWPRTAPALRSGGRLALVGVRRQGADVDE